MKAWFIGTFLAAVACGQQLPSASAEYGAFALPDQTGTRLIATAGMPRAESVHNALCSDGRRVAVRFDHRRPEREIYDVRQVPSHFDELTGDVFRVVRAAVGVTASCFVVGNGWLAGASIIPMLVADQHTGCGGGVEARLAESKGRAVIRCFPLVQFGSDGRVVLAEFARVGRDALASTVVIKGEHLLFGDDSAEFRGEGEDLWRADDGGELSADGFHVMFVARRGDRYAVGVSWADTGGRALTLFVSGSGNGLKRVLEDYWYQMPE